MFENMWLKAEGFVDRVRLWWTSYHFQGSPSFIFSQKLKALKNDLKRWNEHEFDNVEFRKKRLLEELCALDMLEEQRGLAPKKSLGKVRSSEIWRTLLCRRRLVRDRSLGFFGLKRVINALNFFIG
jgi:hypothetical protein